MKTIELSAAIASAPVQENLKNFVGVTPENTVGLMTPERLAAVAGEKMGFNTGTVVIPFGTVAQESLDVAKYVYDNVIKENSSFNYIVRNGAAFSVSGYVIDKKEYGVIIVRCYIKRYCLEFAVLKSEIKPLQ